jgi:hypothetical protein
MYADAFDLVVAQQEMVEDMKGSSQKTEKTKQVASVVAA